MISLIQATVGHCSAIGEKYQITKGGKCYRQERGEAVKFTSSISENTNTNCKITVLLSGYLLCFSVSCWLLITSVNQGWSGFDE